MKRRAETDKLEYRLASIGRSIQSQFTKRGLGTITFGILLGVWSLFIIDYLTEIPFIIRSIIAVGGILYALYYFKTEYLNKAKVSISAEAVSLKVEDQNPELQSRLISTLQFQSVKRLPEGVSENLVEGLVDQAFDQVQDIKLTSVIDHSWIKKHFKRITLMLLIIAGTTALAPHYVMAYLQRFIDPEARYPTRTQIIDVSVDKMIPAGDPFDVIVNAEGILPEIGSVTIETNTSGTVEFELVKSDANGKYIAHLTSITEVAEMSVYLGDDVYGPKTVTPTPRPFLKSINIKVLSPSYTNYPERTETNGNIRVIKGSTLSFMIEASKPLEHLEISSRTKDFEIPKAQSSDGIHWTLDINAERSFSYQMSMKDKDGLQSVDNANYQVSVMRDRPPVIRITTPKGTAELASVSKMPLRFKVNDDIGIDSIAVKYVISRSNSSDDFEEVNYDNAESLMEFKDINNKSFEFDDLWDNTKITGLSAGDTINLWVEATDRSPEQHQQRSSDRQIMIISIQEYRNKLLQRLSENVDKVDEPIINLKDSARKLD